MLSLPASARIYQCVNDEGNLKFSDFPCADNEQQKLLKGNSQNAARSTTEATTDESAGVEGDNTARTVNARYTLKGNLLTIHHKSGLLHPKPWDEDMEIVQYDGEKLTWTWRATRIVLHRLQ